MNSALKPVLPAGGPSAGGQASPAKANVAANHSVALPQGAQNHAQNNLAVQNLTHHPPAAPQQPHAPAPSMAPVTANMAQMAQNMSHHGNLSHATQNSNNSAPPANNSAPSPSKPATSAPLSLVQDKALEKPNTQPLALTRTPEKKEAEPSNQSNGTVESPRVAANAPAPLKPQNPELMKEKQDIGKASPSTPKPPEKPTNAPSTPQKTEVANAVGQVDGPAYAKMAPANEAPEKSPAKAVEPKPAPTADVAPSQSDSKPAPESAKDPQPQVKPVTPQKPAPSNAESAKPDIAPKVEEKKEEAKPEILATEVKKEEVKVDAVDEPKKEAPAPPAEKPEEKVEEKKVETSKPTKAEAKVAKSTIKLATVNTPVRKRRQTSPNKIDTPAAKKAAVGVETPESSKNKRNRTQVQLYQSPTPELTMATKLSASAGRSTPTKPNDDKLIVFYKNEYLAVRNAEGAFYVCQAMQNVYRSTRKIKIRWLSQDKADPKGVTYKPDFYDVTDMECVLTTLSLTKAGGGAQTLKPAEQARAKSILDRAIAAERSGNKPAPADLTEEHPDGLDLSLYRDESQLDKLDKKTRKRGGDKGSPRARQSDSAADSAEEATPAKRARTAAKRGRPAAKAKASPKPLPKPSPKPGANATKRKAAGSPPSKTAAVVTEKPATPKTTPAKASKPAAKKTPAKPAKADTPAKPKVETPATKGRRAVREVKPIVPTPSTSTGKTTRTPRKPPSKK